MAIWLYGYMVGGFDMFSLVGTNISPYDPYIHTYLTYASRYLVSMGQVSVGICGPDIYGYLWTRYLWVSMDQVSMDQVPRYLGILKTISEFIWRWQKQLLNG